ISDQRVVVGRTAAWEPLVFDLATATAETISLPGFSYIHIIAIADNGDLAGTAARSRSVLDDMRGFLYHRSKQAVTWIFPAVTALPPGATPFLMLYDLNTLGHAVGEQGWVRGLDQLEVPFFYDGSTVTSIGSPAFMAGGSRITNSDRMSVGYD